MAERMAGLLVGVVVLGAVFTLIERRWPGVATPPWWRRAVGTDLLYWALNPLFTRWVVRGATVLAVLLVAGGRGVPALLAGHPAIAAQPAWLIVLEMLLVGDIVGYWTHRAFHRGRLWRLHAIHHAPTDLDWLAAARVHPLNEVASKMLPAVALVTIGFPVLALAAYLPFLTFYAILLHANVSWSFGRLRWVLASPRFHRWHHTCEAEGRDRNFASLFPFIDLAFGTLHLPADRQPMRFGVPDDTVPAGFVAQLAYPFRRRRRPGEAPLGAPPGVR